MEFLKYVFNKVKALYHLSFKVFHTREQQQVHHSNQHYENEIRRSNVELIQQHHHEQREKRMKRSVELQQATKDHKCKLSQQLKLTQQALFQKQNKVRLYREQQKHLKHKLSENKQKRICEIQTLTNLMKEKLLHQNMQNHEEYLNKQAKVRAYHEFIRIAKLSRKQAKQQQIEQNRRVKQESRIRRNELLHLKEEFKQYIKNRIRIQYVDNKREEAFDGALIHHFLQYSPNKLSMNYLVRQSKHTIQLLLEEYMRARKEQFLYQNPNKSIREFNEEVFVRYVAHCTYINPSEGKDITAYHQTKAVDIQNIHTFDLVHQKLQERLDEIQEAFTKQGSGWIFLNIKYLEVVFAPFKRMSGSSYFPTPEISKQRGVINIQNKDPYCFVWCALAVSHPAIYNRERISQYKPFFNEINIKGIEFPISDREIPLFEKLNPNYSVNVFKLSSKDHYKIATHYYKTQQRNRMYHVNMVLLEKFETKQYHYALISDVHRFLSVQIKGAHPFICQHCINGFRMEEEFKEHLRLGCEENKPAINKLPTKKSAILKFNKFTHTQKLPYVIYADTEALNKNNQNIMCSYFYIIVEYGKLINCRFYRGHEAASHFVNQILADEKWIYDQYQKKTPMRLSRQEEFDFQGADKCHICKGEFKTSKNKGDGKVRDHDHITGVFRGAAHSKCNLNLHHRNTYVPVFFHNGMGYDFHLFITPLAKMVKERDEKKLKYYEKVLARIDEKIKLCLSIKLVDERDKVKDKIYRLKKDYLSIDVIAKTSERYQCMTVGKLRFMDTYQHLPQSLDKITKDLVKGNHNFPIMSKVINDPELLRKGVFPYKYIDSLERFEETQLPPIEAFYDDDRNCSQGDYEFALYIFKKYNCRNIGDYHDLYLKTDVLLLADAFENYREMCLNKYGLDSAWFISAPSLVQQAMLKETKQEIGLFNDQQINMYLMVEKGIRGGVSAIRYRHQEATEDHIIKNLDMNNLYGYIMRTYALPVGDYQWEDPKQFSDISKIDPNGDRGYLFEVDVHFPEHLHDFFSQFPILPVNEVVKDEHLSPFTMNMKTNFKQKSDTCRKLLLSLTDRLNYIADYRALQQAISLGVVITKIHTVLSYQQKVWMRSYIDMNTEERRKYEKGTFQDSYFKLMNNAAFGKFLENPRNYNDAKLYNKLPDLLKMNSYKHDYVMNPDLAIVMFNKSKVKLDKPIIIGQAILDLAKVEMNKFFYFMKNKYPNIKLLMTDTDSLMVSLPRKFDQDMIHDKELRSKFDLSAYSKDDPIFSQTANIDEEQARTRYIPGLMKDETAGDEITEFVGLSAKVYRFNGLKHKGKVCAKGVKKTLFESQQLSMESFKEILFNSSKNKVSFPTMKSRKHEVFWEKIDKVGLSAYDNKFFYLSETESLPYGHWRIWKNTRS
jgi:hypothetical protein